MKAWLRPDRFKLFLTNMKYLKTIETMPGDFRLQSHILSHFHNLDMGYRNLLAKNYDINEREIDIRLSMSGSKFNESFAVNPIALYDKILFGLRNYHHSIFEKETSTNISITFPHETYTSGIGLDGIININDLNENEKSNIEPKAREGHPIKTLSKKQKPTSELNISIGRNEDKKYYIKTIFPGKYAPPFPNKEFQGSIEYNISREFWDKHIFLI